MSILFLQIRTFIEVPCLPEVWNRFPCSIMVRIRKMNWCTSPRIRYGWLLLEEERRAACVCQDGVGGGSDRRGRRRTLKLIVARASFTLSTGP